MRKFEERKRRKVYSKSKENIAIAKSLNMYGRVPEQWELLQEIERLNENNQAMQEEMTRTWKKLDEKENIIKEVREYIKLHIRKDEEYPDYMEMLKYEYKELLEILDKGE